MYRFVLFVLCLTILIIKAPSPAAASGLFKLNAAVPKGTLLVTVATKCVRLIRRGNQETLINTCGTCKIVGITRKRSGIAVPIRRSFNIQDGTTFPMPFKGPGSSRITSSQNCQDTVADTRDSDKKRIAANQCLELKQTDKGIATLTNKCSTCRAGVIQRMDRNNKILEREAFKINQNDKAVVISKGAAKVGLIADVACPS